MYLDLRVDFINVGPDKYHVHVTILDASDNPVTQRSFDDVSMARGWGMVRAAYAAAQARELERQKRKAGLDIEGQLGLPGIEDLP